jgi:hypothetical protein
MSSLFDAVLRDPVSASATHRGVIRKADTVSARPTRKTRATWLALSPRLIEDATELRIR